MNGISFDPPPFEMPILTYVRWHDVFFHTLPFVRTKGNLKTAAVKRFRGRPCACAESDACGTFEDQKVSDSLRSVAAALYPKSLLPRDRLTHVNYYGSSEPCGPQPPASGGPLSFAKAHSRTTAGHGPKTFPLRRLRLKEPRSSPTPHRGGLQLADGSCMSSDVSEQHKTS